MRLHSVRRLFPTLFLLAMMPASGCSGGGTRQAGADVKVDLALRPDPPKVGAATAIVTLTDRDGQPIRGATVKLEGNMNHAGMTPVFADAREMEPGHYEASLEFTMGGDWFVLIEAALADGSKLSRKTDIRGVKSN
jgi:YtkA-like